MLSVCKGNLFNMEQPQGKPSLNTTGNFKQNISSNAGAVEDEQKQEKNIQSLRSLFESKPIMKCYKDQATYKT